MKKNKIQRLVITIASLLLATTIWAIDNPMIKAIHVTKSSDGASGEAVTATVGDSPITVGESGTVIAPGTKVVLHIQTATNQTSFLDVNSLFVVPYADPNDASARRRATGPDITKKIPISKTDNNTYWFTMPDYHVEVWTTFILSKSINTDDCVITLAETSHVYDWLSHKPTITSVTLTEGTTAYNLIEGTDYTVSSQNADNSWSDGIASITNVGSRTIKITGVGKYKDSKTIIYQITARNLGGVAGEGGYPAANVQLSQTNYVYNHSVQKPDLSGVYMNGQTLVSGTDYTSVSYNGNTYENATSQDAGTYTVTVTGTGNFTGTASKTYTINKMPLSSCTIVGTTSFTYTGNDIKPTVNSTSGTPTATGITISDGVAQLASTDYGTPTYKDAKTGNAITESRNIGSYIMVLTAPSTSPNFTGSVEIPYSINSGGATIHSVGGITYSTDDTYYSETYTGKEIKPAIVVMDGNTTLTNPEGSQYDVEYYNNVNVGLATVVAKGKGVYSFVVSKNFKILPKGLTAGMVSLSPTSFTYNASVQKPTVMLTDNITVGSNTVSAIKTSDYVITNEGGTNYGTYQVTIEGQNNYTGTITKDYNITALSLTGADITLSNSSFIYDRTAKQPTVNLVSIGGIIIPSTDYDVTWTNNTNAALSTASSAPQVTITPHNFGTTEAPICNLSGSASTTFTIAQKPVSDLTITLSATSFEYNGSEQKPTVEVRDGSYILNSQSGVTDYTLQYSAGSTAVGSYIMTIIGQGNYKGSIDKTYVINYGTSDSEFTVTVSGSYTYNGNPHTPTGSGSSPAVTVKKGSTTLTQGTDYNLSYRNNTNAGTATVIATGTGNYQFVAEGTFTIAKKSLAVSMVTFTPNTFEYNGSVQKPTVEVRDGATILVEGTDYTLTNIGATNVGTTYTVTIVGMGNYQGTLGSSTTDMPTYSITALDLSSTSNTVNITLYPLADPVYNGSAKTPNVQHVKVNDIVFTSGYTVSYENNVNVAAGTTMPTVKVTGTGNLTETASTTFVIEPKSVTSSMINIANENLTYTGTAQAPVVTIEDYVGTTNIITTTDYTLTNPTHTAVGNYEVQIDGKGNYKGVAKKQYSIVAAGTTGFTVGSIADQTYTGAALLPEPVVTAGSTTLDKDVDYTLTWANNTNAGENTASVTVTGKGNYSGSKTIYFTILPKALAAAETTLSTTAYNYDGTEKKPTVIAMNGATTLVKDRDYTVDYPEDVINQGTKTVTIKGIGNYTSQFTKTYTINQLSLSSATITLATLSSYVYDGHEKRPAVQLVKVGEIMVPSTAYDVAYSNNINVGSGATVTVTAKTGTNFKDGNTTTFSIERKTLTSDMIILSQENFTYDGTTQKPTVTVKNGETTLVLTTDYTVDNPGGKDVGHYWVNVTGQGNYIGTAAKQYSINAENSAAFDISAVITEVTYNGSPIEPEVTVWKAGTGDPSGGGGVPLIKGTDYEVTYSDNVNAGTATVTVSGIGNYGGTRRATFTILPKDLNPDEITLSQTSYNYNGTEQRPVVTVTDGTKTLKENTDFALEYPVDVKSQGTKNVTIKGIGNYKGTATKVYTIGSLTIANATVTLTYTNTMYNGAVQKPSVQTVYANGIQLTENVDYTVTYPTDADATGQGDKTIVINGAGNYSGSKTVTYNIAPKPVTSSMIVLSTENLVYTGSNLKPDVIVKDGNLPMTKDTDYTLTNDGGTNYGTYNVVITGKGNYTGEAIKPYSIVRKDVSDFTVSAIADLTYDGTAKQPLPEVRDNKDKLMTKGVEYLISYSNNTNVGTATATVTGINSYSGTKNVEFKILPKSLTTTDGSIEVSLSSTALPYTGSTQRPEVIVKDGTKTLVLNTDYTIVNDGGVSVGSYEVKVTGIGNYKDVVTKTYSIGKISLEGATVILNRLDSYVYDGNAKTPSVSEVRVESSFVSSANYTVSYSNNVNVGTATVTVTATETGNCTGSVTATFSITPKTVNSEMITLSPAVFNYDGQPHKPETVTVKDGTLEMTLGTDYTLINEGGTMTGTYNVTITGKGNYAGSASKSYSIVVNDGSSFTIEGISDCVYDGSEQQPKPIVKDGETVLEEKYYTVAYMNNVNAGTAIVTVSGTNGYSFIKSKAFEISPQTLTDGMMTLSATSFVYNGSLQKPEVTMSDGGSLTANDYVLSNEGGTNIGTYRVVATGQCNYTGTIEKTYTIGQFSLADATITLVPLSNATYDGNAKTPGVSEVKVGTVVISADNYIVSYDNNIHAGTATVTVTAKEPSNLSGSATVTFAILPKTVTSDMIELSPTFLNYDGTLQKPSLVTVKDGALPMTKDTDYTLTNEGGTAVGTYQVTITGKGDYTGTASKSYSIVANDASGFSVDAIDDQTFDGTEKTPVPVVKDENGTTIPADGYSVTYLNNVNAGTAFVTVMGKNGYSFIKSQMFTIKPKLLTADMVKLSATEFVYNGSIQRPDVTITDGGTGESSLITSRDYILINDGGANIGTYKVIVNGQNNYTGSVELTYSISLLSLSDATITLGTNSFVYDGSEIKPVIQLVTVGQVIVSSSDYSVTYDHNVNVGTATITITGKGNYSGSKTVTFEITPKSLTEDMVTLTPSSFVYNESLQKPEVTIMDGQKVLVENSDYRLSNDGGTAAGQYDVTITGIGNYTGSVTKSFTIGASDMVADVDVTDEKGHQTSGSVTIRQTEEGSNEVEIVGMNNPAGQLLTSSITIPLECTSGGKTYKVTGISDGAFANMSDLKDVYLPETKMPLTIGAKAFPDNVTIHVPLALLDDYALMPSLEKFFKDNKVKSTVKVTNRFWTFSSGVDVTVPDNVSVYIVHERNDNTVSIVELTDDELMVGSQRIIKANNGVLFECKGFVSEYDLIASAVRMSSGTAISTDDHKDYGLENRLEPVIESKHYESGNYYFLKNNEFYHIKSESETVKVPAGKAVLYLSQQASTRGYSRVMGIVGNNGRIEPDSENGYAVDANETWYDMSGQKLDGAPKQKGVYIHNNKKVIIK